MTGKSGEHMDLHFNRRNGYVYIARGYKGNIKIGGAFLMNNRIRQLRIKDRTIKLIAFIKSDRFMYLEKFLHVELSEYKIANEWYKDEPKVIRKVVDFLKNHGVIFGAHEVFFTAPSTH